MKKVFLALCLCAALVAGCSGFNRGADTNTQQQVKSNPELEREYREEVRDLLAPVFSNYEVTGVREALLDVTVPSAYLDLHLDLVLALDAIETARQNADQAGIEAGLERIDDLADQYDWLK